MYQLKKQMLRSIAEVHRIAPEWADLWQRCPVSTTFQRPQWLLPWLRHYGSDGELTAIVMREGDTLTSLAPLYVLREDDESLGMLLGTGISDYLDVLGEAKE